MNELMLLERLVLESISSKNKSIDSILSDTGLELSLVMKIISRIMARGLIRFEADQYHITDNMSAHQMISKSESMKEEVCELSSHLIGTYFNKEEESVLKLQKVYLDSKNEKILNALLNTIEIFIRDIQKDQKKLKNPTCKKKVILWGHTQYTNLVENILNAS